MNTNDVYRCEPKNANRELDLSLPLPPSVNHMYYNTKGGGKRLTKRAEDYVRRSRSLINLAVEECSWRKQPKHTWYYIDIVCYMPDRRIRDSHNMLKLLLDSMQGIVFENDYYAMPRIQSVEYDKNNPRLEIKVTTQTSKKREKALKKVAL